MASTSNQQNVPELLLDDKTQRSFISWFRSLPQDAHLVRIFDRKDFYSAHGEDALFIARTFYKTTAVVKYLGSGELALPGVTLNRNLFETVLRSLLLDGADHTVEVYEGTGPSWRLARSASPGRLSAFEDELFRSADATDAPVVVALTLSYVEGQRMVGIASVDVGCRAFNVCELPDDDQLCSTESVLVGLGAREVVLSKDAESATASADARRLSDVISRCGAMATFRPRTFFNTKHLEDDLGKLLRGGSIEQQRTVLERRLGCSALAAALAFLELSGDPSAQGRYSLALYDPGRHMRLDAAALRALNVLPSRGEQGASFSLYGIMNRARSAMGKRKLKVWLKQPLVDLEEIRSRHAVVGALVEDTELRERLRDVHLRGMPDIERLARKLEQKKASLADLCQLYRASAKLPLIEEALRCHAGDAAQQIITRYAEPLSVAHNNEHLSKFEELLEAAVDLERVPEEYLICADYDDRLQRLRADKDRAERSIDAIAAAAADDLDLVLDKTIKLEWHKVGGGRTRCLRITQKEEKAVRSKLNARYTILETRKDGTKFLNKALREAGEKLTAAASAYEELQRELVGQVISVAATFVEVWEVVAALVAELDVLAGLADLAVSAPTPYVRPEMLDADAGRLVLEGCRHPCVEVQEGVNFIKNDCRMVKGEAWFHIITGPNMGGKSTFIRQVGVVVLMAQIGSFVPADATEISVRDAIFARVGAGDCQAQGVSTFMAEMLETGSILRGATPRSLVIVDELGRGTSTYDGFGLAWAISEHLMEIVGAPTLFATHFHELTELRGTVGVANQHVATHLDPQTGRLTMMYAIRPGPCDQSFGIHVAESACFPPEVVEAAKQKLAELEGADTGSQGVTTAGQKRKREEDDLAINAKSAAAEFLNAFAALPLPQLGPAHGAARVRELVSKLESEAITNPVLASMLQASAA